PHATNAGARDSIEDARTYIRHETGTQYDGARVDSFLRNGARMLEFLEANTEVHFEFIRAFADFHAESPGGSLSGREIGALPFDGRKLGRRLRDLAAPRPEERILGTHVAMSRDRRNYVNALRSPRAAAAFGKFALRQWTDRLLYGGSTDLRI